MMCSPRFRAKTCTSLAGWGEFVIKLGIKSFSLTRRDSIVAVIEVTLR